MRACDRVLSNVITTASAGQRVRYTARVSSVSRVSGRDFSRRPQSKKSVEKTLNGSRVAGRAFDVSLGNQTILSVVCQHKPYVVKCILYLFQRNDNILIQMYSQENIDFNKKKLLIVRYLIVRLKFMARILILIFNLNVLYLFKIVI